jgi:hypothetical protein
MCSQFLTARHTMVSSLCQRSHAVAYDAQKDLKAQLQFEEGFTTMYKRFEFPVLGMQVSVQANWLYKCELEIDGHTSSYPMWDHYKTCTLDELPVFPLRQATSFEVTVFQQDMSNSKQAMQQPLIAEGAMIPTTEVEEVLHELSTRETCKDVLDTMVTVVAMIT